ncbi:MAG: hypothetical protein QOJ00_728 [Actinomycetota bacterium]
MKRNNAWLAWALAIGMLAYMLGAAIPGRTKVNETPGFTARATGVAVHADVIQAGATGPRVVDGEIAFSAVNANSDGFGGTSTQNEMQVNLQPNTLPFAGKQASARGGALELGLGSSVPTPAGDTLAETESEAVAPPNSPLVVKDAGPLPINPVAYASLLHTEALANYTETPCLSIASSPIAYGRGYAADAQLLDTSGSTTSGPLVNPVLATDDPRPNRNVSQTVTYLYSVPNSNTTGGQHYGLVTETHETFAPVTVLRMAPAPALIIEVLGEWIFKTTATGIPDNPATVGVNEAGSVQYYVVDDVSKQPVTPTTDVIRISADGGLTYTSLRFQDVFMNGGLVIPAAPLLSLAVGEDPRALAAPGVDPDPNSSPTINANGTGVSGAADVVRLSALSGIQPGFSLAGLRIGHFESALTVPSGGFTCSQAVTTTTTTAPTSSTTSTTLPGATTTTTLPGATTTTTLPGATTTTLRPTTTTSADPGRTTTTLRSTTSTSTPPPTPIPRPIRVQPNTVG